MRRVLLRLSRFLPVILAAGLLGADDPKDKAQPRKEAGHPVVVVETSLGTIKIELYPDKAPLTVKTFLGYVDDKFYDGTIFHRVLGKPHFERDYLIQGGGYEPGLKLKKTKEPIKNESANGLSNVRGAVGMARDTREADSAMSQFYVNVGDNRFLDRQGDQQPGWCVFGKVIEGMDVVDKIKAVKTATVGSHRNVPTEDVVIKKVYRAGK